MTTGVAVARLIAVAVATAAGPPLGRSAGLAVDPRWLAAAGFLVGAFAVALEWQARRAPIERLFWGAVGGVAGLGLGAALGAAIPGAGSVGAGIAALVLAYAGAMVAVAKVDELAGVSALLFRRGGAARETSKILDTSVIIDGRIVDVCENGFLEGPLLVPEFVLRELQQIADSSDGLRRNRAKRGFDVLERLRRIERASVRIDVRDFPDVREVDHKLLALARATGGTVVTNDYALNRLAGLSGVAVLNVNELASALRPVLLPGEPMRVQVVKEGKEAGQGVAYLDDGTMVVIDHGRRFIGQHVDATVTTVLQTTAGRMIFARPRDDEGASR